MKSEKLFKVLAGASFTILISAIPSIFTTTIKATCIVTTFLILELVVVAVILAFDDYTLRKNLRQKLKGLNVLLFKTIQITTTTVLLR